MAAAPGTLAAFPPEKAVPTIPDQACRGRKLGAFRGIAERLRIERAIHPSRIDGLRCPSGGASSAVTPLQLDRRATGKGMR